jgi:inward rectifier potassium channel
MFSKVAVITPYEGVPTLIFRCANQRGNQILEADITISLAHQVTTLEGLTMRRMEDMKPLRSRSPLLSLTWMIMHRIDETSPLFGATPDSLALERGEVVVMLSGIDDVSAQRIHARHSYVASDIVWNRQLADIIYVDEEGGRVVNYDQFHELKPAPTDPSLPG